MRCLFIGTDGSRGYKTGATYNLEVTQRLGGEVVVTRPNVVPYASWEAFWRNWRLVTSNEQRKNVNLPVRPFLYTLDQVGTILNITAQTLHQGGYLFYSGRTPGVQSKDEILAHNIAPPTARPEWRVEERELIRWLKRKGFRVIG